MRLVIDIGNTRAKWGLCDERGVHERGSREVAKLGLATGWGDALANLARPDAVVVGCVAGNGVYDVLSQWTFANWGLAPRRLKSTARAGGVVNGYEDAALLGIDRWAAIVASRQKMSGPICIVDAGSACTVDMIDAAGHHRGGWIVPGLGMQAALLAVKTDGVRPSPVAPSLEWGRNTDACVANGCLATLVGLIDVACRLAGGGEAMVGCILTGGDATAVAGALTRPVSIHPDLVIEGLDLLARLEESSE